MPDCGCADGIEGSIFLTAIRLGNEPRGSRVTALATGEALRNGRPQAPLRFESLIAHAAFCSVDTTTGCWHEPTPAELERISYVL